MKKIQLAGIIAGALSAAVIGFGALGWSVRRDLLDAGDPEVAEADSPATERRRRRPRDEDVEDALLER